ncbi:MAG TPA: hypothetical protein H9716_09590 [Candidatus Enterocloster faecavium]|uniref:Uncharacterized protein n=1 Tax=Candidatus Enterocloster faecavium TaxID=2838560 RepID=A0A9D2L8T1_9FIRM|nr:hypothetical protein [Candidatus Enterocloster faecavium]
MKDSKSVVGWFLLAFILYILFLGEAMLLCSLFLPVCLLIAIVGGGILVWLVRKLVWFPSNVFADPELGQKIFSDLEEWNVDVYILEGKLEKGGRYIRDGAFLPLIKAGDRRGLVLQKRFLEKEDPVQIRMTAMREIGKYLLGIPQKNLFGLIDAFLLVGNLLVLYLYNRSTGRIFTQPFWFDMVAPAVMVLILLVLLLSWNNMISKGDRQLDQFMLQYFSIGQLEAFIKKTEKEEGGSKKQEVKGMNEWYMKERIEFLKKEANK